MTSPIHPFKAVVGKCYEDQAGNYLGKYVRLDAKPRNDSPDAGSGQMTSAIKYVFENRTIGDGNDTPRVKEVPCKTAGRRKTKKKARRRNAKKRV